MLVNHDVDGYTRELKPHRSFSHSKKRREDMYEPAGSSVDQYCRTSGHSILTHAATNAVPVLSESSGRRKAKPVASRNNAMKGKVCEL